MNTRYTQIMGGTIAVVGVLAVAWIIWGPSGEGDYPIQRTIRYSFTVKNDSAHYIQDATFWTYAPVKTTSTQRTINLEASHPYTLKTDALGNQQLHFMFKALPPYSNKIVRITAQLALSDEPNDLAVDDREAFLQPAPYIQSDAPAMQRLAKNISKGSDYKTAQAIYTWAANNIKYSGYIREDRGALYALKQRKGDCTESMYLFTALSRANGIPARGVGGYVVNKSAVLRAEDYHNWAEFYYDSAWWIADPQKKTFAKRPSRYIAMRIMGVDKSNSQASSHRFAYAGKGLTVLMN
ncbi:MAG TPA: transglutaminase domain-containing protein [Acidiferrobacteraceae bacterium]|nr:transglutaminase domain-containing protein [Acidiferrobacteraceae bacterium]